MRRRFIRTSDDLKNILSQAAIEFDEQEDGSFYVCSFRFNIWMAVQEEDKLIHISTFFPVRYGSSEVSVFRFANKCNQELTLAQFCVSPDFERFNGFYQLNALDGADARHVLRTASMFANEFFKAINELDEEDLIGVNPDIEAVYMQKEDVLLH